MKFEDSGSKGTRVIERKRSVTDRQTDKLTGQLCHLSGPCDFDLLTQNQ